MTKLTEEMYAIFDRDEFSFKKLKEEYFRSCVGKTEKVLIQRRESEEYANGLTPQYVPVRIYGSDANRQDIITVQITGASGSDFCVGEEIKCL